MPAVSARQHIRFRHVSEDWLLCFYKHEIGQATFAWRSISSPISHSKIAAVSEKLRVGDDGQWRRLSLYVVVLSIWLRQNYPLAVYTIQYLCLALVITGWELEAVEPTRHKPV